MGAGYLRQLLYTQAPKNEATVVCQRRSLFAASVASQPDEGLPKLGMLGEMVAGEDPGRGTYRSCRRSKYRSCRRF